ncbi:Adenylate cyclase 2 [Novipirellula aureliae]|uniref:Adenylate cyclase 2 n=1 Tax=Novipirellula aureliae TaxID=2527966 RepID=A0A5C6ECH9_9BACT|nr:adenylate/guanylate cyclase domain-containing protein [Novipirellula aureliae]TWU45637.1 Adenylate cyclase 2 [Novipirellula aureliae]
MLDLIAQGPAASDRWRRPLPEPTSGREISLGRSESDWIVPWDGMISRKHVKLRTLADKQLEVVRSMSARNAVFYRGQQNQRFKLSVGEHFVIGETTFTFANRPGVVTPDGIDPNNNDPASRSLSEHAYNHTELRERKFRDGASRIEMLTFLPDLITSSEADEELLVRMTNVLLQATPSATSVAIVSLGDSSPGAFANRSPNRSAVEVLHYDSRNLNLRDAAVSTKLVQNAITKGESILQIWSHPSKPIDSAPKQEPDQEMGQETAWPAYTTQEGVDWAYCVPLRSEACRGWGIYVSGEFLTNPGPEELQDDLKFAELVGSMVANLRQSHRLERRQAAIRQFFAPVVMDALARRVPDEVLAPRETMLTVMFSDLRGFSRRSEQHADALLELLGRVSESLGLMTRAILETGGVIGDFHGDAAMGFWGWPLEQSDRALRAARAAMQIRHQHASKDNGSDLLQYGIGIASGPAVAGQIGTADQVKVTAFGPVVNLASRLEGLTKSFGVNVIVDQATVNALADSAESDFQFRRLARVRPAGFSQAFDLFELLTPLVASAGQNRAFSAKERMEYEKSLLLFIKGDWAQAQVGLEPLAVHDSASRLLLRFIEGQNAIAPDDWSGAIDIGKN